MIAEDLAVAFLMVVALVALLAGGAVVLGEIDQVDPVRWWRMAAAAATWLLGVVLSVWVLA